MFVVEITAVLVTLIVVANVTGLAAGRGPAGLGFQVQIAIWLWFTVLFATYAEAVAEARGRAQAATLRTDALGDRPPTGARPTARSRTSARPSFARATSSSSDEGETIPGDGDVIEGVGLRQRGRDHRRVRAGAQGARHRHPQLASPAARRSSATGSSSASRPIPGETFLDRMIALVEGAKRQRTPNEIALVDPARRADPRLPAGDRDAAAVRRVRRRDGRHRRARRPARVPHPDDDRRPPVRDRHRRHGPRRPLQRAGDERPRRRGVRRRRRHPARQDRHDHLRQPARGVDHAGARRRPRPRRSTRRARRVDPRRDARGPLDRRAGPRAARASSARPAATATTPASRRSTRPSPRSIPFRAETRTSGVRTDRRRRSILKGAVDAIAAELDGADAGRASLAETDAIADRGRHAAGDPLATAGSWASSSSRTRSRRASSSASPSSAGWASGP